MTLGEKEGVNWQCETTDSTDNLLVNKGGVIVSSDSGILKRCDSWFNLIAKIRERFSIQGWFIELL